MKHLKNSLVVFAVVLAVTAVVTVFSPSYIKGGSNQVPKTAFSSTTLVLTSSPLSGPDPEGTNYAISSLTLNNETATPVFAQMIVLRGASSDCLDGSSGTAGPAVRIAPLETIHVSFPQPYVFSADSPGPSCLKIQGGSFFVTVVGSKF